jgi:hypothetical protein
VEKQMTRFIKPDLGSPSFAYTVDEEALEQAERLDGKLLLVTSLSDMAPEEVVARYRSWLTSSGAFACSSPKSKSHRSIIACQIGSAPMRSSAFWPLFSTAFCGCA